MGKVCKDCGKRHRFWWDCPLLDGTPEKARKLTNYNWHFGQFANDARREAFHKKAFNDPFGV